MKRLSIALLAVLMLLLFAGCAPKDDPSPPADADISAIAVDLVTDMSDGDFAEAADDYAYAGKMRRVVSETFFRDQVWEYLVTNYGAFQEIGDPIVTSVEQYEVVTVPVSFESADFYINVTFDADRLIAGIHSVPVE